MDEELKEALDLVRELLAEVQECSSTGGYQYGGDEGDNFYNHVKPRAELFLSKHNVKT
jgi:hypothetical protein